MCDGMLTGVGCGGSSELDDLTLVLAVGLVILQRVVQRQIPHQNPSFSPLTISEQTKHQLTPYISTSWLLQKDTLFSA